VVIVEEVKAVMKEALKAKDQVRLDAARMAQAAFKNLEIEKGGPLDEGDAQKVIATLIKQRREAAEQFRKGNRAELAAKEEQEMTFLETLLPPQLAEAEIVQAVDKVISETGASGPGDIGKVMKPVMAVVAGRADGSAVRRIVQERLTK
jgi:uncharacterized protein YqeY